MEDPKASVVTASYDWNPHIKDKWVLVTFAKQTKITCDYIAITVPETTPQKVTVNIWFKEEKGKTLVPYGTAELNFEYRTTLYVEKPSDTAVATLFVFDGFEEELPLIDSVQFLKVKPDKLS
jgi:hypothetical protein